MVRSEQVRTLFYSTESQEAKSEVLSISAICPRACHSRSSHVYKMLMPAKESVYFSPGQYVVCSERQGCSSDTRPAPPS